MYFEAPVYKCTLLLTQALLQILSLKYNQTTGAGSINQK